MSFTDRSTVVSAWVMASALVGLSASSVLADGFRRSQNHGSGEPDRYAVTDLGALPWDDIFRPRAINNLGQVVGTADHPEALFRAIYWEDGQLAVIETLGGRDNQALDMNDLGVAIGFSSTHGAFGTTAFRYEDGEVLPLGTLGGYTSSAQAINDAGQITGGSELKELGVFHAFLWDEANGMQNLGTLGGDHSVGRSINDVGQVVGDSRTGEIIPPDVAVVHPFLWEDGQMVDLGSLGGPSARALAINNSGVVIGVANLDVGIYRAFLWTAADGLTDLGTLGGDSSKARGINNHGVVVGHSSVLAIPRTHAVRWQNGEIADLNDFIFPGLGWILTSAAGINDAGQIVGIGRLNGGLRGFLLTPITANSCPDDDGDGRVTICHSPPGNPDNNRTITVNQNALSAHLWHGDQCGACDDE